MFHAITRAKVRGVFAALNRSDYDVALAGMAPRFTHTFAGDHAIGGTRHTLPAMRAWFERLFRLNERLVFGLERITVSGPPWDTTTTVQWVDTAELAGGATMPDGAAYVNRGVHVIRMRWGRVTRIDAYLDTARWQAALGQLAAQGVEEAQATPIED